MEAFFLRQTLAGYPVEAVVLESEYLQAAESPQAEPAPLRRPVAVAAEGQPQELRGVGILRPLSGGLLKLHRALSKNTTAAVADILAVSAALRFGLPFVPYPNQLDGPGTPLSASLLISNEIL